MATRSQIRNLGRVYISQTDTSNTDFSDSDLNGFIDEGIRFLGALVKKPIDHVSIQATDDTALYTLPSDAVILLTAYFGDRTIQGDVKPIQIIPEEELKSSYPSWLDQTSSSKGTPQYLTLLDRRTVMLTPRPNAAESATGKKLHIGYCYQPAALGSDSDSPDLPIVYHDLVSQYIAYMCYMSKLNKPELGTQILSQIIDKAAKLEDLIVKDSQNAGFFWGSAIDPNYDGAVEVTP